MRLIAAAAAASLLVACGGGSTVLTPQPTPLTPALQPLSSLVTAVGAVSQGTSTSIVTRATFHAGNPTASQQAATLAYKSLHVRSANQVATTAAAPRTQSAAGTAATYVPGSTPPSTATTTVTASRSGQNFDGESSVYNLVASAAFSEVIVAVTGYSGYYDLQIASSQASENISLTFAQAPPVTTFTLVFAVGNGSTTAIGSYASVPTTLSTAAGTGDVQVNLSWNAPADLDLHVVDPAGNEIYYGAKTGTPNSTGGSLDIDSNAGCAIDNIDSENATWPTGTATHGTYTVRVDEWDSCAVTSAIPFTVTVNAKGQPQQVLTSSFPAGPVNGGDRGGVGAGTQIVQFTY